MHPKRIEAGRVPPVAPSRFMLSDRLDKFRKPADIELTLRVHDRPVTLRDAVLDLEAVADLREMHTVIVPLTASDVAHDTLLKLAVIGD